MHTRPSRISALASLLMLAALGCKDTPYQEVKVDLAGATPQPRRDDDHQPRPLHFSVAAMQSPRDTFPAYSRLFSRVGQLLGVETELVQRRTYGEVNQLLLEGRVDAALLCTGGYLDLRRRAAPEPEILAVPVVNGKTTYQSLIIVPAASPAQSWRDLAGTRFAFTDELSLSGRAYVVRELEAAGTEPGRFFRESIFTRSHDKSVEAVSEGLVDGAVVDSLIYDLMVARTPQLAERTRVIHRSIALGMMPVVAAPSTPPELRQRLREVLLGLDRDPAAAAALRVTHIEKFVVPEPALYDSALEMMGPGK